MAPTVMVIKAADEGDGIFVAEFGGTEQEDEGIVKRNGRKGVR